MVLVKMKKHIKVIGMLRGVSRNAAKKRNSGIDYVLGSEGRVSVHQLEADEILNFGFF